ncbi:MAG: ubiquinol oxidase subunit II [Caulobacteraceae bacterium]|nr:ubiquinol oxidase subunit II [Caulobacteraceae bacterium]
MNLWRARKSREDLNLKRAPGTRRVAGTLTALCLAGLGGCKMDVLNPAGRLAVEERDLILFATGLMLLIILPVIFTTLYFAWKYRASNRNAKYDPSFEHSGRLEVLIWGAPIAIIVVLGTVTWITAHRLDPYRPLDRSTLGPAAAVQPLEVDAIALDWKWLFIYPQQGVATVNELVLPVNRAVTFKITASSVMNAFFVPAMAGQIYAMPGMQTQLHAILNKPGVYKGFSSNYSGAGYSDMNFRVEGLQVADFDRWVSTVQSGAGRLDRVTYAGLAKPSINEPVRTWARVDRGLYGAIVEQCAEPGQTCQAMQMANLDPVDSSKRVAFQRLVGGRICAPR